MAKNIAVFLDGTWNSPDTNTNVWKSAKQFVAAKTPGGKEQIVYYDAGVGKEAFTWIRGGAFGKGLAKNVRQAYQFIAERYEDGDQIFLFGFSRGAYTARSVAGMIVRYGLVRNNPEINAQKMFDIYSGKETARRITTIERLSDGEKSRLTNNEKLIMKHSRRVDVQFMGLWDTVGMLGIPKKKKRNDRNSFHHRGVSSLFKNVAHALSIDENRKFYKPTVFCKYAPDSDSDAEIKKSMARWAKRVEQRWFAGSHGDVGGSKESDLGSLPLNWIIAKSEEAGLAMRNRVTLNGNEATAPYFDSYKKAGMGIYRLGILGKRHHRPIGRPNEDGDGFKLICVNEKIDGSVFERWQKDSSYRPKNLQIWADAKGLDLNTAKGDQAV